MDRVSMEAAAVDAAAAAWKAAGQPYRHLTRQALKAAGKTEATAVATVTIPATADPDVLATIIRYVLPQRQGWHPAGQVDWPKVLRQAPLHRITWAVEADRDWQARSR